MLSRKYVRYALGVLALLGLSAAPARAHTWTVNITPSCACEYSVTISGNTFEGAGPVTVFYSFDVTANGQTSTVQNVINTNADSSGSFSVTIDHNSLGTACGDSIAFSNPTTSLKFNGGPIEITGGTVNFFPETLFCGPPPPPPPGKTFDIGPSSMEGHLLIRPGDWISGGYSFVFVNGGHPEELVTVSSTLTLPITCPQGGGSS